jgi:hypothetical protein
VIYKLHRSVNPALGKGKAPTVLVAGSEVRLIEILEKFEAKYA